MTDKDIKSGSLEDSSSQLIRRRAFLATTACAGTTGLAGCSMFESYPAVKVTLDRPQQLTPGVDNLFLATVQVTESGLFSLSDHEVHEPEVGVSVSGAQAEISRIFPGNFARNVDRTSSVIVGQGVNDPWTGGTTKTAALAIRPETSGTVEAEVRASGHPGNGNTKTARTNASLDVAGRPDGTVTREMLARDADHREQIARNFSQLLRGTLRAGLETQLREASMSVVAMSGAMVSSALIGQAAGIRNLADYAWETLTKFVSPFEYLIDGTVPSAPESANVESGTYAPPFFSQLLNHANSVTDLDAYLRAADKRRVIVLLETIADYAEREATMWRNEADTEMGTSEVLDIVDGQLAMLHESIEGSGYPEAIAQDLNETWRRLGYDPGERVDPDRHDAVNLLSRLLDDPNSPPARNTIRSIQQTLLGHHRHTERLLTLYLDGGLEGSVNTTNEDGPAVDARWPMYQFDAGNTGHVPEYTGPTENVEVAWRFDTDVQAYGGPTVSERAVYVGIGQSENGGLRALDPATGDLRWSFDIDGGVRSAPAISNGILVFGAMGDDSGIYGVDATTGEEVWSLETGWIQSDPVVVDGTAYVGTNGETMYALDVTTGEVQWEYEGEENLAASPAVAGGLVYASDSDGKVYALEANTGTEAWTRDLGPDVVEGLTVAGGTVFVSQVAHESTSEGEETRFVPTLFALDSETGEERFQLGRERGVVSSVATDGETFVVYLDDLRKFDFQTRSELWSHGTGFSISDAPVIADDTVYICYGNQAAAVRFEDGEQLWELEFDSKTFRSPVVYDNRVYVGLETGLVAVTEPE